MKKNPEPRLEITIRDWCPTKDQPIWVSHCMEVNHFVDLRDPIMVLKEIMKNLQRMIKIEKEQNLRDHIEKVWTTDNYFEELPLDKLPK